MIYDHDDQPLVSVNAGIKSEEAIQFKIEIDCKAGYFMRATPVADLLVQARHHGTGGAFTDIESTPFDLTPWDGSQEEFDIRITAGVITEFDKRAFRIILSP